MTRIFTVFIWALFCGATTSLAQGQPIDDFNLSIEAESEADQATIFALAQTFAILSPRTSGLRKASLFTYRSGADLVAEGVPTQKLSDALPDALATSVATLTGMRNPCDISRHTFQDTDVLVVVHSSEAAQPQDAHRCFVAGLWIYHAGGNEGVNVDNWRVPYARIIGSVAGGRPAFAGFPQDGN